MGICSFKDHRNQNSSNLSQLQSFEHVQEVDSKNSLSKTKREKSQRISFPQISQVESGSENFKVKYHPLKTKDINFIIESLKNSYVFFGLKDSEFEEIISNMFYGEVEENTYLFKQNDPGFSFFLIDEGLMQVEINGKVIKQLKKGDCFGEIALLYNAPRSGSIKSIEKSYVFGIEGQSFKKVLQEINTKEKNENLYFLDRIDFLKDLEAYQKELIANYSITQKFQPNQAIVNKGDMADSFFFIKKGIVSCFDGNTFVRDLKDEQSFGEQALFKDGKRTLTVVAKVETKCLAISRTRLQEILGDNIQNVFYKNVLQWTISNHKVFNKLVPIQKLRWINNVKFQKINNDKEDVMIEEKGNSLANIYAIIDGYLQYGYQKFQKGDIFGIDYIYPTYNGETPLVYNLITQQCVFAYIEVEKLFQLIGAVNNNLDQLFHKNQNDIMLRRKQGLKKKSTISRVLKLQNLYALKANAVSPKQIQFTVVDKESNRKFLVKAFSRNFFESEEHTKSLYREVGIIQSLNFAFIIKLYNIFQDENALYFVYSPSYRIDMFDMIQQIELFDQEETKFYVGSLILCLEYLNEKNIIYRDLKPENIVIDEQGYVFLHDFGPSKRLREQKDRTNSIVGTPHYMAPEIIQGVEYNYLVDLWSLGICMYEFMCGFVPFGEDEEDPYKIYYAVVSSKLKFPDFFNEAENTTVISFIQKLLNRLAEGRIDGGFASLKSHKWFEDFDWSELLEKLMKPPYLPPETSEYRQMAVNEVIEKDETIQNTAVNIFGQKMSENGTENHQWKTLLEEFSQL